MNRDLSELISLTQIHLLQNYGAKEWLWCDQETYAHFKAQAQQKKIKQEQPLEQQPKQSVEPLKPESKKSLAPPKPESKKSVDPLKPEPNQSVELPKPQPKQTFFSLEPMGKPKANSMGDMHTAVAGLRQVKVAAPAAVVVLACGETGEELLFIHNVSSAIDRLLQRAELINLGKEANWKPLLERAGLKWIIAFGNLPGIETGIVKMGPVSILMQPSASLLLRDLKQKGDLWKLLKSLL